jgi:hypothetical protein
MYYSEHSGGAHYTVSVLTPMTDSEVNVIHERNEFTLYANQPLAQYELSLIGATNGTF